MSSGTRKLLPTVDYVPLTKIKPGMVVYGYLPPGQLTENMCLVDEHYLQISKSKSNSSHGLAYFYTNKGHFFIVLDISENGVEAVLTSTFNGTDETPEKLPEKVLKHWEKCTPIFPTRKLDGQEEPIKITYEGELLPKGGWMIPSPKIILEPQTFENVDHPCYKKAIFSEMDATELARVKMIAERDRQEVGEWLNLDAQKRLAEERNAHKIRSEQGRENKREGGHGKAAEQSNSDASGSRGGSRGGNRGGSRGGSRSGNRGGNRGSRVGGRGSRGESRGGSRGDE